MIDQNKLLWMRITNYGRRRSLTRILDSIHPNHNLGDQVRVFGELIGWAATLRRLSPKAFQWDFAGLGIKHLIQRIEDDPQIKKNVVDSLGKILSETDPTDFLVEVGLVNTNAFFSELVTCLILKRMPQYQDFTKLGTVTGELLKSDFEPEWLTELPADALRGIAECFQFEPAVEQKIRGNFAKAIDVAKVILTSRIVSLSANSLFTSRVSREQLETLVSIGYHVDQKVLSQSRSILDSVHRSLENQGVSIELVFLIDRIKSIIGRLEAMLWMMQIHGGDLPIVKIQFAAQVLQAQKNRYSLLRFLNTNLALISKNIVERNSVSGEKYIARTAEEREHIFFSAAGGGAIVALCVVGKYWTSSAHLPLFIEGLTNFLNYTATFLAIQFAHLTLATKTPAITASSLASKMVDRGNGYDVDGLMKEVRAVVRTGALAILGNALFAIFIAVVQNLMHYYFGGQHIFDAAAAEKYLKAHHPFYSLALWYAALTGVVLWLGSAIGGWFENWYVFRGIPQAIAESPWLRAITSERQAQKFSAWLTKNIQGIATSVALSFFLAFASIYGQLLGLPIDVRHVTLSSGNVALSIVALPDMLGHWTLIVGALFGVALIGTLNFSVSLIVSFIVAGHARALNFKQFRQLIGQSTTEGLRSLKKIFIWRKN